MNDAHVDVNEEFSVRRRYPPKVVWPSPDNPVVWVVVDVSLPESVEVVDHGFHERIIGVYSTYRNAVRGLINDFIESDGKPLKHLNRLTWEIIPNPGYIECWDEGNWGLPGSERFIIEAFNIDGPTP